MLEVEDSQDVVAAKVARAEVVNEEKEFEENQRPSSSALPGPSAATAIQPEISSDPEIARVEAEMEELMEQVP